MWPDYSLVSAVREKREEVVTEQQTSPSRAGHHHAAASVREKMASNDFLENAISSKIDEKSLTDLTNSLESSLPSPATVTNQVAASGKTDLLSNNPDLPEIIFSLK